MKTKKQKIRKVLSFIIFIVLSAGFGYMLGKLGAQANISVSKTTLIAILFLIIPAFFVVIAFHEAGHAFAGTKVNFDFRMYVVGPFLWTKEQNQWIFNWNKNVNTAGGLVVCLPTDNYNLNKRFAIYAAGGPLASLGLTLIAFLLFLTFNDLNPDKHIALEITASLFLLIAVFSLLIFIVTVVPFHTGGFSSDGARILRILKGGEAAKFEMLMLKIIANTTSGVRPKNIEINEQKEALSIAKKLNLPQGVYLHGLLHQTEFDLGNLEAAETHLKNYLDEMDEIPAGIRNAVLIDAAFFYAYAKHDLEKAQKYWLQFKSSPFVAISLVFATEAAICVLKSENDQALLKIEESLKNIPKMLDKGLGLALTEKLAQLKNEIEGAV